MGNVRLRAQALFSIITGLLVLFLPGSLFATGPGDLLADSRHAGTVFQSESLRIYRVVDDRGRQRLVLTNLDNQGNRLSPDDDAAEAPPNRGPVRPAAAVEMNEDRFDDETATEEREISVAIGEEKVVRVDDGKGTTIVININPPPAPAPAPETIIVPAVITSVIGFGGIAGPYRFPENHPFLGYGTGIRSPAWMGGLGLNAGNRYGLNTGTDCGPGFDCMFPPSAKRP